MIGPRRVLNFSTALENTLSLRVTAPYERFYAQARQKKPVASRKTRRNAIVLRI
jgi:hypothetical protein